MSHHTAGTSDGGVVGIGNYATFTATNSHFTDNSARNGGVLVLATDAADASTAAFVGCTLANNQASLSGGVIEAEVDEDLAALAGLVGNSAAAPMIRLVNSTVEHNTALTGGAVAVTGVASVEVQGSTLTNNDAEGEGGVLAAQEGSSVYV